MFQFLFAWLWVSILYLIKKYFYLTQGVYSHESNDIKIKQHFRPFHAFGLFLYLKKISEKQVFWFCQWVWKETRHMKWMKELPLSHLILKFILGSPTVFQNTRYLLMNIHNFCQTWVSLLVYTWYFYIYELRPASSKLSPFSLLFRTSMCHQYEQCHRTLI